MRPLGLGQRAGEEALADATDGRVIGEEANGKVGHWETPGHAWPEISGPGQAALGAAWRTPSSTESSNWAKLAMNLATSSRAVSSYCRGSAQAPRGSSSLASTPGTATGTSNPKFGSLRNSASLRLPSSAALSSARVALIGIRLIPGIVALPPDQPVLTSQHLTPPLAIRSFKRLP